MAIKKSRDKPLSEYFDISTILEVKFHQIFPHYSCTISDIRPDRTKLHTLLHNSYKVDKFDKHPTQLSLGDGQLIHVQSRPAQIPARVVEGNNGSARIWVDEVYASPAPASFVISLPIVPCDKIMTFVFR